MISPIREFIEKVAAQFQETSSQMGQQLSSIDAMAIASEQINALQAQATNLGVSSLTLANALKTLPQTAAELAREMPKIARRLQNGAGLRPGDAPRSEADIMKLFAKIPGTSKLEANERSIREFLADKHGSHIMPRSQGGSNQANNIVWEIGADNIQRGAAMMTGGEQLYIRVYNAVDSILKNSTTIAKLGITATGAAVVTQAVVTAISYSLDLYRGDITIEEYRDRVLEAAISAGMMAPVFFLILIAVLALFPELTLLLSAPAVVAGLNALLGIGIATPIVQSLLRHLEAGGFGTQVAADYQALSQETQSFLETSTAEIRQTCQEINQKVVQWLPAAQS
jgi:hypothetical protein